MAATSHYPADKARIDCNCGEYCVIVLDQLETMVQDLSRLKDDHLSKDEQNAICGRLIKCNRIAKVFTGMCIESFLNDYISACLGENEFKKIDKKLSAKKKLQYCAEDIMHITLSEDCKDRMEVIVQCRNEMVHNKSHLLTKQTLADRNFQVLFGKEAEEYAASHPYHADEQHAYLLGEVNYLVLTLKTIAEFFDEHDDKAYAMRRLFCPPYGRTLTEERRELLKAHNIDIDLLIKEQQETIAKEEMVKVLIL